MLKRWSRLALFGCFFFLASTLMRAQCGSDIREVTENCGVGCGFAVQETCEGVGTACEDGTGDIGFGCCGLMVILPGSCQFAKGTPSRELLPSEKFLAFREALAVRKKLFPGPSQVTIASCAPDKNAFNDWLQAKLRRQREKQ